MTMLLTNDILTNIKERSPFLAKTPADMLYYSNGHNVSTGIQSAPEPGSHFKLNDCEKINPNYKYFEYYINDIRFRDPYPSPDSDNIMGFFGCSFTFGEGLDTNDNFPIRLSNTFNKQCLNLGKPGASAHRIALIFAAAANIWKMDTAVFTLPNWGRFHYVASDNKLKSIHPPHVASDTECEAIRVSLLKNISNQYLMSATKDAINYIVTVAKLKNIKIIIGSWDPEVVKIVKETINYQGVQFSILKQGEVMTENHYARDRIHPGISQVTDYCNNVAEYIKNENYVKL